MDEPTPILRADATDDDLQDDTPIVQEQPPQLNTDVPIVQPQPEEIQKDTAPEEPASVDPDAPKRMVPVVVSGVLHGYREE